MTTSVPRTPRTPQRNSFSIPGTPSWSPAPSDASIPEQLQHLATQIVTQTVSSRAQLKTVAEQLAQIAQKQDEVVGIARAEEARRQNRVRSLAEQPLLPVVRPGTTIPEGLPPISSQNALEKMSTQDLSSWYAYYTSSRPDLSRGQLTAALGAEVGLSTSPPPYNQAVLATPSSSSALVAPTPTPSAAPPAQPSNSVIAKSKEKNSVSPKQSTAPPPQRTVTLSPTAVKWIGIFVMIGGLLALSVRYSDNGNVQQMLQQLLQLLGQYVLKSGLFVYQSSLRLLDKAEDYGSELWQHVPSMPGIWGDGGEFKTQVI